MRIPGFVLWGVAAQVIAVSPLVAQRDSAAGAASSATVTESPFTAARVAAGAPFASTAFRAPSSLVSFRASRNDGDKVAGVEVQLPYLPSASLKLGVSAPLEKGQTGPVLLGDLKGLHDATKITLSASGIRWLRRDSSQIDRAFCTRMGIAAKDPCIPANLQPAHPDEFAAYEKEVNGFLRGSPMLFGLQAEYGRQAFRFRDAGLVAHEVERAGVSVDAAVGWFYRPVGLISFGGRYENAFQGARARQICFPLTTGSTALQCESTALSAPVRSETFVGTFEVRRYLGASIGINPSVSYRTEGSSWGVQVPIYFAPDEKNTLIGGMIPSWNNVDRKFTVSFFVGQTFGLRLP